MSQTGWWDVLGTLAPPGSRKAAEAPGRQALETRAIQWLGDNRDISSVGAILRAVDRTRPVPSRCCCTLGGGWRPQEAMGTCRAHLRPDGRKADLARRSRLCAGCSLLCLPTFLCGEILQSKGLGAEETAGGCRVSPHLPLLLHQPRSSHRAHVPPCSRHFCRASPFLFSQHPGGGASLGEGRLGGPRASPASAGSGCPSGLCSPATASHPPASVPRKSTEDRSRVGTIAADRTASEGEQLAERPVSRAGLAPQPHFSVTETLS